MISFVHAADLHLDSPFTGVGEVDEDIADLLRGATFKAFENLVRLCIESNADFLLIAGDVYDGADRSLKAQLAFRDGLGRLAQRGIRTYVAHGNHDPLDGWASSLDWPEEVHVFGGRVDSVSFEKDGEEAAVIHGMSYPHGEIRENLARRFHAAQSEVPQIGLLHCNVGSDTGHEPYAPCSAEDLVEAGMDYWALGHVHAPARIREEAPAIVYPGTTQGRHVGECGPSGCYCVEIDRDEVRTEFVPVDAARWASVEVDISELDSDQDLLSALEEELEEQSKQSQGRPVICRLALRGRGPLHANILRERYVEDLVEELRRTGKALSPMVWVSRLRDETRPSVNREKRRQAEDIVGGLLRLVDEFKEEPEKLGDPPECLRPLLEHRELRRHLEEPDEEALAALLDEAESCCMDWLLKEDEG